MEERVVERLDLLVAQPSQPDPPEGGKDVKVHVAFVAPVGARREVQLLGRQPLAGEVGTEGQGPNRVDPASLLLGQRGGEPLSPGSIGAGRVPPAQFLAGYWVSALVDDHVEPVPSLCHVSIH